MAVAGLAVLGLSAGQSLADRPGHGGTGFAGRVSVNSGYRPAWTPQPFDVRPMTFVPQPAFRTPLIIGNSAYRPGGPLHRFGGGRFEQRRGDGCGWNGASGGYGYSGSGISIQIVIH